MEVNISITRKDTHKNYRLYFAQLKLHNPKAYARSKLLYKQTPEYAARNRANVKAWRKKNRETYNAYQRVRYARTK